MLNTELISGDLFYVPLYNLGWYLVLERSSTKRLDLRLEQKEVIEVNYLHENSQEILPSNSVYRQGRLIFGPGAK